MMASRKRIHKPGRKGGHRPRVPDRGESMSGAPVGAYLPTKPYALQAPPQRQGADHDSGNAFRSRSVASPGPFSHDRLHRYTRETGRGK